MWETVRVPVLGGASPDTTDEEGKTRLDKAREIGHPELQRILEMNATGPTHHVPFQKL